MRLSALVLVSLAAGCAELEVQALPETAGDQTTVGEAMLRYLRGERAGTQRVAVLHVAAADPRWDSYRAEIAAAFTRALTRISTFQVEEDLLALEAAKARALGRDPQPADLLRVAAAQGYDLMVTARLEDLAVTRASAEQSDFRTGLRDLAQTVAAAATISFALYDVASGAVRQSGRDRREAREQAAVGAPFDEGVLVARAVRLTLETHLLALRRQFGARAYVAALRGNRAAAKVALARMEGVQPGTLLRVSELTLEPDLRAGRVRERRRHVGELRVLAVHDDHVWAQPVSAATRAALRIGLIVEPERRREGPIGWLQDFLLRGRSW